MSFPRGGNGLDLKKINSDMTKTLDALINEKSADLSSMVSLLWPWDRKSLAGTTDITYSTDTTLTSRLIYGDVITINSGVTVTTMTGGVVFICNEFINNGTLTASGKGAAGGATNSGAGTAAGQVDSVYVVGGSGGAGGGYTGGATGAGGAAHAGAGGALCGQPGADDYKYPMVVDRLFRLILGGLAAGAGGGGGYSTGGGVGGYGGGAIVIICETFNNAGAIRADGLDGAAVAHYTGGGGGGGAVIIDAVEITAEGTISADGGAPGAGNYRGGAGGDGITLVMERWAA